MEHRPVPEVPFNEEFEVRVAWSEDTTPRQALTLEGFRAVILDDGEESRWRFGGDLTLKVGERSESVSTKDNSLTFSRSQSSQPAAATLVLHGSESFEQTTLIFFDVKLVTPEGETVVFDPPWAKKKKGGSI